MYFQQAYQGNNKWWLYLIALLSVVIAYAIGSMPLLLLIQRGY